MNPPIRAIRSSHAVYETPGTVVHTWGVLLRVYVRAFRGGELLTPHLPAAMLHEGHNGRRDGGLSRDPIADSRQISGDSNGLPQMAFTSYPS